MKGKLLFFITQNTGANCASHIPKNTQFHSRKNVRLICYMSIVTCNCILCYLSSFLGTISSTGLSPPISITVKSQFLFITKLDDAESL